LDEIAKQDFNFMDFDKPEVENKDKEKNEEKKEVMDKPKQPEKDDKSYLVNIYENLKNALQKDNPEKSALDVAASIGNALEGLSEKIDSLKDNQFETSEVGQFYKNLKGMVPEMTPEVARGVFEATKKREQMLKSKRTEEQKQNKGLTDDEKTVADMFNISYDEYAASKEGMVTHEELGRIGVTTSELNLEALSEKGGK
jgi:hypothetical protein